MTLQEVAWIATALSLIVAISALVTSIYALARSNQIRHADSFAKLYDEINGADLGAAMECIANWARAISTSQSAELPGRVEVCRAYRIHLEALIREGMNTKTDELEHARRRLKAWFIKCLLIHESRDLTRRQLVELIPTARVQVMRIAFNMTREQTDVWRKLPHDPNSRTSTDESYFERLERIFNARSTSLLDKLSR